MIPVRSNNGCIVKAGETLHSPEHTATKDRHSVHLDQASVYINTCVFKLIQVTSLFRITDAQSRPKRSYCIDIKLYNTGQATLPSSIVVLLQFHMDNHEDGWFTSQKAK